MSVGELSDLEARLGHRFDNPDILRQALTHASMTPVRIQSNERLEFLGDRVLGLIVAEMLFEKTAWCFCAARMLVKNGPKKY